MAKPPLPRRMVKNVPPNVPKDIAARDQPSDYAPQYLYGTVGVPPAGVGAPIQSVSAFPPPWVYPPPVGSRNFYIQGAGAIGPGPTGYVLVPGTRYVVPNGFRAIIREINLDVNNLLATSNITFQLRINNGGVQGYTMAVFPRALASFSSAFGPDSTMVFVPEGGVVEIFVNVVDAVVYNLGASYRGWQYTDKIAVRYEDAY